METQQLHVIFGSGPLGKWTARTLSGMGKRVRMINRSGQASDVPAGVEVVKGDAYDVGSTTALAQGATAVYQCAQPAYYQWAGNFPRMQAAILEGATATGARLIVAENLYIYGESQGRPLSESTPLKAHTKKGRLRQAMTEELFAAHRNGRLQVASARGSNFFGPDDSISAEQTFQPALAGKALNMLGRMDMPHSFTYAPDFGRALAILGTRDEGLGQAWHVPSAPAVTQSELVAMISEAIGRPVRARPAGALMLGLIGLFNPTIAELREMLYEFTQPFVIDSSRFTKTFGMQPTPLRDAVRATVEWNQANTAAIAAAHA